jgi:hypothetical protein
LPGALHRPICAPSKQQRKSYRVEAKMKRGGERIGPAIKDNARFFQGPAWLGTARKLASALKPTEFLRATPKRFKPRHHSAVLHLDLLALRLHQPIFP